MTDTVTHLSLVTVHSSLIITFAERIDSINNPRLLLLVTRRHIRAAGDGRAVVRAVIAHARRGQAVAEQFGRGCASRAARRGLWRLIVGLACLAFGRLGQRIVVAIKLAIGPRHRLDGQPGFEAALLLGAA